MKKFIFLTSFVFLFFSRNIFADSSLTIIQNFSKNNSTKICVAFFQEDEKDSHIIESRIFGNGKIFVEVLSISSFHKLTKLDKILYFSNVYGLVTKCPVLLI